VRQPLSSGTEDRLLAGHITAGPLEPNAAARALHRNRGLNAATEPGLTLITHRGPGSARHSTQTQLNICGQARHEKDGRAGLASATLESGGHQSPDTCAKAEKSTVAVDTEHIAREFIVVRHVEADDRAVAEVAEQKVSGILAEIRTRDRHAPPRVRRPPRQRAPVRSVCIHRCPPLPRHHICSKSFLGMGHKPIAAEHLDAERIAGGQTASVDLGLLVWVAARVDRAMPDVGGVIAGSSRRYRCRLSPV